MNVRGLHPRPIFFRPKGVLFAYHSSQGISMQEKMETKGIAAWRQHIPIRWVFFRLLGDLIGDGWHVRIRREETRVVRGTLIKGHVLEMDVVFLE